MTTVSIMDLHKTCSFPMVEDAKAMSDCCRRLAVSAVVTTEGNRLWRCYDHSGLVNENVSGKIILGVEVDD